MAYLVLVTESDPIEGRDKPDAADDTLLLDGGVQPGLLHLLPLGGQLGVRLCSVRSEDGVRIIHVIHTWVNSSDPSSIISFLGWQQGNRVLVTRNLLS